MKLGYLIFQYILMEPVVKISPIDSSQITDDFNC